MAKVYEDRMLIESRISTGVYLESETVKQLYNGTLTEKQLFIESKMLIR